MTARSRKHEPRLARANFASRMVAVGTGHGRRSEAISLSLRPSPAQYVRTKGRPVQDRDGGFRGAQPIAATKKTKPNGIPLVENSLTFRTSSRFARSSSPPAMLSEPSTTWKKA
jgi:hypothetical protein